jgi:DNA polymerase III gamma/tau subunit
MSTLFELDVQPVRTTSAPSTQATFTYPQSLTAKYRPLTLDGFVGLDEIVADFQDFAANPFPSAYLFFGPSGVGKTSLAMALADAIPAEFHHIPSQDCNLANIERVRRICQYVPMMGKKMHLVLVDEADQMTAAAQISLLSKLDETNFPPNTVFIFTANDTDLLADRFLSRLRRVKFSKEGISKDVAAHLARIWALEVGDATAPNFATIVKEAKNNIRECLMELENRIRRARRTK